MKDPTKASFRNEWHHITTGVLLTLTLVSYFHYTDLSAFHLCYEEAFDLLRKAYICALSQQQQKQNLTLIQS